MVALAGCGSDDSSRPPAPGRRAGQARSRGLHHRHRQPVLADTPGSRWIYRETDRGDASSDRRGQVTTRRRRSPTAWRRAWSTTGWTEDGKVVEDTDDWYAQDPDGQRLVPRRGHHRVRERQADTKKGSFEAGVDGAQAGVIRCPADPKPGMTYRRRSTTRARPRTGASAQRGRAGRGAVRPLPGRADDRGLEPARAEGARAQVLRPRRRPVLATSVSGQRPRGARPVREGLGNSRGGLAAQAVAGAAHRLDRVRPERLVDLLAQVADVDVNHVRAVLVLVVPGVLEQAVAVRTSPGWRMNVSSSANSWRSGRSRRRLARRGGSGRDGGRPPASTVGLSTGPRRPSARRRASSSAKENGLVR